MIEEYIKRHEGIEPEWGESDCQCFINNYLRERFPENKLPKPEYKSLLGAMKELKKYEWIRNLSECFEIHLIESYELRNGDLVLESQDKTIPSIYIYFDKFIYTLFPGIGFIKIRIDDLKDIKLIYIHIKGIRNGFTKVS